MTGEARRLETGGEDAIYAVPRLRDISPSILQKIAGKHPEGKVIFRPRRPEAADLEFLAAAIPDEWFCQIGFTRKSIEYDQSSFPPAKGLALRPPASQSELESVLTSTFHSDGLAPWQTYIGDQRVQDWTRLIFSISTSKNTAFVTQGNEVIAAVVTFPHKDCLGTLRTNIGWIWIAKNLSRALRPEAHILLFKHLAKIGPGPFQAAVHLKNIRSQLFFAKYGFVPQCIHLYYQSNLNGPNAF